MNKVRKMVNVSGLTVPVELETGTTVFVPPRGVLENEKVKNLEEVRKFFKIQEDLGEVVERRGRRRINERS